MTVTLQILINVWEIVQVLPLDGLAIPGLSILLLYAMKFAEIESRQPQKHVMITTPSLLTDAPIYVRLRLAGPVFLPRCLPSVHQFVETVSLSKERSVMTVTPKTLTNA